MKVLVVTPYYLPKIGGLEIYAHQLNIALHRQEKWEVVVVTSNHHGRHTVVDAVDGVKVYRLSTLLKFSNTPLNPLWPFMMHNIIKKERPDVIMAHTPVPSLADAAALAACKTPLVVVYHAATLFKKDAPVFNTIAREYKIYENILLHRAKKIFAVSDFVKQQLSRTLQPRTVVVPNAVWERQIITRPPVKGADFLFVGSLDKTHTWKGQELIIKAFARYYQSNKSATLTFMGDGNARGKYEALVKELQVAKSVKFLGNVVGAKKDAAYKRAAALIAYPTTANDAFPTVVLEAWAKEVPVIAASIGALPTIITHNKNGYLVEPDNVEALEAAMHAFVHIAPAKKQAVTAYARQQTLARYTWEKQAALVSTQLKELL
jgi:rhamnosyl/mannosyltransferase